MKDKCQVKGCNDDTEYKLQPYKKVGEVDYDEWDDVISLCEDHYTRMCNWMQSP